MITWGYRASSVFCPPAVRQKLQCHHNEEQILENLVELGNWKEKE